MNPKLSVALHLVFQILGQTAVKEVVPAEYQPILTAIVAVIGVFVAFSDKSLAQAGGWKK